MKTTRTLLIVAVLLACPCCAVKAGGPGLWGDVGVDFKLYRVLDMGITAEYRWQDSHTDSWGMGLNLSSRLWRSQDKGFSLKAAAGYKLSRVYSPEYCTYNGNAEDGIADGMPMAYYTDNYLEFNLTEPYWRTKHKVWLQLQAKKEVGRFTFSLKERYQFAFSDSLEVGRDKYRSMFDAELQDYAIKFKKSDVKVKGEQRKHILRTSARAEYNIKGVKLNPFAGIDIYNDPTSKMALDKTRLTAGVEHSLGTAGNIALSYIWQNRAGDDELAGSAINLSYSLSF